MSDAERLARFLAPSYWDARKYRGEKGDIYREKTIRKAERIIQFMRDNG